MTKCLHLGPLPHVTPLPQLSQSTFKHSIFISDGKKIRNNIELTSVMYPNIATTQFSNASSSESPQACNLNCRMMKNSS